MNIADMLAAHAAAQPARPAIIADGRVVSHGELHGLVIGTALRLRAAGIATGDIVAARLPDSAAALIVACACARLGAIVQPIDPASPPAEQAHFLRAFGARAVVSDDDGAILAGPAQLRADAVIAEAGARERPGLVFPSDPDLPCELATSSGTTGAPKGFLVTHAQQRARYRFFAERGVGAEDRYLSVIGLRFNMGLRCAMAALHLGGAVAIERGFATVRDFVAACARHAVTWTYMMPAQLRPLLAGAETTAPLLLLPGLRLLVVAGSPLWPQERAAVRARVTPHLEEIYGANEVGAVTLATARDQEARPDSVGRVLPGFALEIVDDDEQPVAAGSIGLVRFRGPGMTAGYVGNPEATARAFRDGWFHPGDRGLVDGDGYLALKGRADDVINCDGIKIDPADVEAALLAHPAVVEAAVLGWQTARRQEVPVGLVILREDVPERRLIAFCRERLASYKVPRRVLAVRRLPHTANGKIARARLGDALREALQGRSRAP